MRKQCNPSKKELELYLHIPFCIRKCHYCDFLSGPAPEDVHQAYINQMLCEIRALAGQYHEFTVRTIFIGGGTPSVLAALQIRRLSEQLMECFAVSADAEITIECNPGTLDADKLRTYRESGVNRLSIGLQSADDGELRLLGRIHTYEQFVSNYVLARKMGFDNINIDLMSALPGQNVRTYERTLRKVTALEPEHISSYSLLIEKGTPFYYDYGPAQERRSRGLAQNLLPSEEEERLMYVRTKEILERAGYDRYEISNYAKKGFACRHNIGYWTRENYLGFGIGAASMVENIRFCNQPDLEAYLGTDFTAACELSGHMQNIQTGCQSEAAGRIQWRDRMEPLDTAAQMEEFMFLGLRMVDGISSSRFYDQFSVKIEDIYGEILKQHIRQHLVKKTETGYALTDYGIDVSNYVLAGYLFG